MNPKDYKGVIVEESLKDNRVLNGLDIFKVIITGHENPSDRWHMYAVNMSKNEIERFSQYIKDGWYMHFWKGTQVIAIFKGKQFEFDFEDKSTWGPVIEYGISIGIPKHQLDFPINIC